MSKTRAWYGRPNPPPANWHTPGRPVVRRVIDWSDDVPDKPAVADDPDLIAVSLKNGHWITILKALQLYSEAHGDDDWRRWRKSVREVILGAVNPNTDESKPVGVRLSLEDWRLIWQDVHIVSEERGGNWCRWFSWLSQEMTCQLKASTGQKFHDCKNLSHSLLQYHQIDAE